MRAPTARRIQELPPEFFNGRWVRVLQIESASEDDATRALMAAIQKGWRDRMGGVCHTGHEGTPFGVVLEKESFDQAIMEPDGCPDNQTPKGIQ